MSRPEVGAVRDFVHLLHVHSFRVSPLIARRLQKLQAFTARSKSGLRMRGGVVTGTVFTCQERVCRAVCLTQFQRLSDRENGLRRPQNALYLLDVTVPS